MLSLLDGGIRNVLKSIVLLNLKTARQEIHKITLAVLRNLIFSNVNRQMLRLWILKKFGFLTRNISHSINSKT